jgi:hypothetical protein
MIKLECGFLPFESKLRVYPNLHKVGEKTGSFVDIQGGAEVAQCTQVRR